MKKYFNFKNLCLLADGVLLCGLLLYCAIFFMINKTMSPLETQQASVLSQRVHWRLFAENVVAVCRQLFIAFELFVAWYLMRKRQKTSFKKILFHFIRLFLFMMLCMAPFVFLDMTWWQDYLFTAGELIIKIGIIMLILSMIIFAREKAKPVF